MPLPKDIGSCEKDGTGKNQGRQWMTPLDNWWFNCKDSHSKSSEFSSLMIFFLFRLIIQSSIYLSCPRLVNIHPALRRTLLVITGSLLASTVTHRAMSCHQRWYLCLLHWTIQSLIKFICTRFVNSNPDLHRTQHHSCKLRQYLVRLQLNHQIPSTTVHQECKSRHLWMRSWCV